MPKNHHGHVTLKEFLLNYREAMPAWLGKFRPEDKFCRIDFFTSRVVYYPGAGNDGHAVAVFGAAHAAHCFVYADYMKSLKQTLNDLTDQQQGFMGYTALATIILTPDDVTPRGWTPQIQLSQRQKRWYPCSSTTTEPFALLAVLERHLAFDDSHGPERLAILFLGADGIATYDALFCQLPNPRSPYAILIQDHGYGGNYDKFGRGGLLERLAIRCKVLPEWLLSGNSSDETWRNYDLVPDVIGEIAGMARSRRRLYRHTPSDDR